MKKIVWMILFVIFMNDTVYGWEEVKIQNKDMQAAVYEEKGTLYAEPMLLEKGGCWHILENENSIFAKVEVGNKKIRQSVELPFIKHKEEKYIDFSFFSKQAGLSYSYDEKEKILVVKQMEKTPAVGAMKKEKKVIYMWDPEWKYKSGQPYFSKNNENLVISPTWGSYKTIDENRIPFSYIKELKKEGIKVEPLLHNDFDISETKKLMRDKRRISDISDRMTALAVVYDFRGWNLDFENMDSSDIELYTEFVKQISESLHQENKKLSVDITVYDIHSPNWSLCYDRAALAKWVDYEIIMGYDQTAGGSKYPGPTSSYDWLDGHVARLLTMVPKEKLILGLPLYTRVWRGEKGYAESSVLTLKYTNGFINRYGIKPVWDYRKKQYISSWIMEEIPHKVWLEEYRSLSEKLKLISKYELKGVAFWRYGFETQDLYSQLEKVKMMEDILAPAINHYGEELILKFRKRLKEQKHQ